MIKRTLVVSNKAYLSKQENHLIIEGDVRSGDLPVEDIGVLMLENPQITVTHGLLASLMENNTVVVVCGRNHHPLGIMNPIASNVIHTRVIQAQAGASLPLKKLLWKQTVKAKLLNQAAILERTGLEPAPLRLWAKRVRSGDSDNLEGRGAAYYWSKVFPEYPGFTRDPEGDPPNQLLNYGYSILRAAMARALVSSGLHPALGIFHKSQYNPFTLADDIMEPYRPFVDWLVCRIIRLPQFCAELDTTTKKELLSLLTMDVVLDGEKKPLMTALSSTTASVARCFLKEGTKIAYPNLHEIQ